MVPVAFPQSNIVIGRGQEEYDEIPALLDSDSVITSCWRLSEEEIARVMKTGVIWVSQITFGRKFQPQVLLVDPPFPIIPQ